MTIYSDIVAVKLPSQTLHCMVICIQSLMKKKSNKVIFSRYLNAVNETFSDCRNGIVVITNNNVKIQTSNFQLL